MGAARGHDGSVPFFEPVPEPPPPVVEETAYYDFPWHPPNHWLPGLGDAGVTIARTPTTAVFVAVEAVYPRGLSLALEARVHPDHPVDDIFFHRHDPRGGLGYGLRFGLEWPDGSRAVADGHGADDERGSGPRLSMAGSRGGGLTWSWEMWLTPLPPPGPVTVHVLWPDRGIEETSIAWDLTAVVARADEAEELWSLPSPPREYGWTAYAPMGMAHGADGNTSEGES